MDKEKFSVEYIVRSSPAILYNFLVTPSGLAQWFADSCDINDEVYSFGWNGSIENATLLESEEEIFARFQWEDSEDEEYFEFRISKSEISNDTILTITDFADEFDMEDQQLLWEKQVKTLLQQIGG